MTIEFKKSFLIYLIALIIEFTLLVLVIWHADWLFSPYLSGFDTFEYTTIAKNLVENQAFSKSLDHPFVPNFFRSPGYPFWLAFLYLIFNSFTPAIFLGMFVFSFSASLIYLIMREIFSERLAFWSGIVFALEPRMAFSAPFILSEQIFLPIFLASILFAVKFFHNPQKNIFLHLSAILLGVSALVRGVSLYLWPIFVILFSITLYKKWPLTKIIKTLALSTVIFIFVMSPWLIRNKLTLGTWQPSSLFGLHLYWGHLETLERYLGVSQDTVRQEIIDRAVKVAGNNFETPQAVNMLAKEAITEIRNNLWAYTKIYIFNTGLFFVTDGYKGIVSYIVDIRPNYVNLGDFIVTFQFNKLFHYLKTFSFLELAIPIFGRTTWILLTILGFSGMLISIKETSNQRLLLILFSVLIFYFAILTGPIFSPDPRFRMPVNGFLITFALVAVFKMTGINYKHE